MLRSLRSRGFWHKVLLVECRGSLNRDGSDPVYAVYGWLEATHVVTAKRLQQKLTGSGMFVVQNYFL